MKSKRPKAERCGECGKPLPADSHWNRRYHVDCAKRRRSRQSRHKPALRKGTPSLCTPHRMDEICQAAAYGAYRRHCAANAGISDAALGRWLQRGHDALVNVGLDPDVPPADAAEKVPESERAYVTLRVRYMRVRARGAITLLAAQRKCGVGGAVYEDDPNAPNPKEYDEIVKALKAAGRADLIPILKRPQRVQVGYVPPDAKAAARALAVSHGYTEKQQVELSGAVEATEQPALMVFLPELDKD